MELLRFATAGSVDDGKSTLIGRLLYDSKSILADQLEAVERTSRDRGEARTNLALLTDGLRSEREQGITIDVAYRYFSTPERKFIIADTPGHLHYTRNMVTGASTADVALVLVDARNGLVAQSRRHAYLAVLLGIRHLVLCVNKMDLVDYDQATFDRIDTAFRSFVAELGDVEVVSVPVSALVGDNVVVGSPAMPWYSGPTLLDHLETVEPAGAVARTGARLPVQYVLRPHSDEHHDFRGYAGTVAGDVLRVGDEVVVQPSGRRTTVTAIDAASGPVDGRGPTGGDGATRRRTRRGPRRPHRGCGRRARGSARARGRALLVRRDRAVGSGGDVPAQAHDADGQGQGRTGRAPRRRGLARRGGREPR